MSTTPDKDQFDSAESLALSVLAKRFPDICTRAGSAVRELVVRPMSMLYATWMAAIEDAWRRRSPATLLASTATENADADEVASYYGVTRSQGAQAKGTVLFRLSRPSLHIPAGTRMTAGGVALVVPTAVSVSSGTGVSSDTVTHVRAVASGSEYLACVGVMAVATGAMELPSGVTVTHSLTSSAILDATLSSPLTGGSDTETDAELMARALRTLDGSGAGTLHGIRRLLDLCPTAVTGLSVLGQGDQGATAQENPVGIGVSGVVDCFVRTQSQEDRHEVTAVTEAAPSGEKRITISGEDAAGVYSVVSVLVDGEIATSVSVAFSGTRLGTDQSIAITLPGTVFEAAQEAVVTLSRMPGITSVQEWLDRPGHLFIGQRDIVRAAVPVRVGVYCMVRDQVDDTTSDLVSSSVARYVNGLDVGAGELNFSDIRERVAQETGVELGLPCTLTASVHTRSGGVATYTSTSGILRVEADDLSDRWPSSVCFFSCTDQDLRLSPGVIQ